MVRKGGSTSADFAEIKRRIHMERERKNLLVFGYGFALIFTFFGVRIGLKADWPALSWIFLGLAVVFASVTAVNFSLLKPVYAAWMKIAHAIGFVMTTLILGALFYLMFGVIGIILRILRKDILDKAIDKTKASYWIQRKPVVFDKNSYQRQF